MEAKGGGCPQFAPLRRAGTAPKLPIPLSHGAGGRPCLGAAAPEDVRFPGPRLSSPFTSPSTGDAKGLSTVAVVAIVRPNEKLKKIRKKIVAECPCTKAKPSTSSDRGAARNLPILNPVNTILYGDFMERSSLNSLGTTTLWRKDAKGKRCTVCARHRIHTNHL